MQSGEVERGRSSHLEGRALVLHLFCPSNDLQITSNKTFHTGSQVVGSVSFCFFLFFVFLFLFFFFFSSALQTSSIKS